MNWYYLLDNKQTGPLNEQDFNNLVHTGIITSETLVWREGMDNWQRYAEVAQPAAPKLALATAPTLASGATGVICCECGNAFAPDEVIRYGNVSVCAACKPIFVQKLREGVAIRGVMDYAGFWTRFAAQFVDGLILWVINFILGLGVAVALRPALDSGLPSPGRALAVQGLLLLIQLAIGIAYEVSFLGRYGATPGKMACKIKVVTPEGNPITYGRAFGRYFAKLLSGMILLIGYIMAAFDPEKRTLHDRICHTRVVRTG